MFRFMRSAGCSLVFSIIVLCLSMPLSCLAQASPQAREEIQRKLIAEEAAATVDLPFGGTGAQVSDRGEINREKLRKELEKNGKSVQSGRIVTVTGIHFSKKKIEIELDGGGKDKKEGLLGGHLQVGVGGAPSAPNESSVIRAKGSKISLVFAQKVSPELTPDQLRQLLSPILDFSKRKAFSATVESLPKEFQEAVLAKEARIGMDEDTVLLALGRPNQRTSERVNGVDQKKWRYDGRGLRKTFVTFENRIVVQVTEH